MTPIELLNQQRRVRVYGAYITKILAHGCSDGNCRVTGGSRGMHTNGGCRCMRALADYGLEMSEAADRLAPYRGLVPLTEPFEDSEQEIAQWGA